MGHWNRIIYQDKIINYGLGYQVQIIRSDLQDLFNPDKVTFVWLAHPSKFTSRVAQTTKGLPYINDLVEDAVKIDNYSLSSQDLKFILKGRNLPRAFYVKQGDLIGYAGNS